MSHDTSTIKQAIDQVRCALRESTEYFRSIEVCLMIVVAAATVGGFWLAFLGDPSSLIVFAFAWGYLALRVALHIKRIVSWPFL